MRPLICINAETKDRKSQNGDNISLGQRVWSRSSIQLPSSRSKITFAIRQYTQAALRDVIGNNEMDAVLMEREKIAESIKEIVDIETNSWGVDIESIKIQEIELPAEMKRAMARQAEAERERRATIIASQGELSAAENLRDAAEKLAATPGALHLRTCRRSVISPPIRRKRSCSSCLLIWAQLLKP